MLKLDILLGDLGLGQSRLLWCAEGHNDVVDAALASRYTKTGGSELGKRRCSFRNLVDVCLEKGEKKRRALGFSFFSPILP